MCLFPSLGPQSLWNADNTIHLIFLPLPAELSPHHLSASPNREAPSPAAHGIGGAWCELHCSGHVSLCVLPSVPGLLVSFEPVQIQCVPYQPVQGVLRTLRPLGQVVQLPPVAQLPCTPAQEVASIKDRAAMEDTTPLPVLTLWTVRTPLLL